jgi:signal transduction histidine kinase
MMTDILNDFLSVGKIEEGKIPVRMLAFDVEAHVSSIVQEMIMLRKKQQHIDYQHTGDKMITLDPSLLKHIVQNLLSNAIKFSPEQDTITVRTTLTEGKLVCSIKDNGIGISKEDQQHLFERFFRGNNVSDIQGTGLGLHIVSKYAELMNGSIRCRSEENKGTEFIVTFKTNSAI